MSLEFIMDASGAIDHGATSTVSGGSFSITATASTTVQTLGSGVYSGDLTYTFSGGDASGFEDGSVMTTAPQKIVPTAQKVNVDGAKVIRLGDSGAMACIGTIKDSSPPTTGPVTGAVVEVSDAGQDKVKAQ